MQTKVLLISGSLREGSLSTAVLSTAQQVSPPGISAYLFTKIGRLPHFNPDDDRVPLDGFVEELRELLGQVGAVLICTPEYAGALPGSFKNMLDWTVGGGEMDRKSVGWINASSPAAPTGGEDAHASLRKVMGYIGAVIVEPACINIPMSRRDVGTDGLIHDSSIRTKISEALTALARSVEQAAA